MEDFFQNKNVQLKILNRNKVNNPRTDKYNQKQLST